MGWRFRRTFSTGGFRWTISKSGVGGSYLGTWRDFAVWSIAARTTLYVRADSGNGRVLGEILRARKCRWKWSSDPSDTAIFAAKRLALPESASSHESALVEATLVEARTGPKQPFERSQRCTTAALWITNDSLASLTQCVLIAGSVV